MVRIIQLLCPSRHCIVATAYESTDAGPISEMSDRLRESFDAFVKAGANPWCGICQSRNLQCEDRATKFATLKEAMPHLEELVRLQAIAREYFRASKG